MHLVYDLDVVHCHTHDCVDFVEPFEMGGDIGWDGSVGQQAEEVDEDHDREREVHDLDGDRCCEDYQCNHAVVDEIVGRIAAQVAGYSFVEVPVASDNAAAAAAVVVVAAHSIVVFAPLSNFVGVVVGVLVPVGSPG